MLMFNIGQEALTPKMRELASKIQIYSPNNNNVPVKLKQGQRRTYRLQLAQSSIDFQYQIN